MPDPKSNHQQQERGLLSSLVQFRVDEKTREALERLAKVARRDFTDFMRLMAEDAVKNKYKP